MSTTPSAAIPLAIHQPNARRRLPGLTRLLAFLLPTTAALGSALPVYGPLFGFRVLVLILIAIALGVPANRTARTLGGSVATLACLWLGTGVALTSFSYDKSAAFRTLTSVAIGFALAWAALRITAVQPRFIHWLAHGWFLSFVVTSVIAFWEIYSGEHLPNYFIADTGMASPLPAASFFNPNAYAIYLVGVQGLLLWRLSQTSHLLPRTLILASSAICILLIVATGSRLSLAGVILLTVAFLALDNFRLWRSVLGTAAIALLAWQLIPSLADFAIDYVPDVKTTFASQILVEFDQTDTSAGRRMELYKTAVWLTADSWGVGVGPGNFGAAIMELHPPYQTGDTLSPHSFVGEVGAEFGIPALIGLCLLFWSVVRRLAPRKSPERATVLATGLAFLPASLANSGYLIASSMWVLFATMLCLTAFAESEES